MNDPVWLEEPELQFGSGRHIDVRFGIMNRGAFGLGRPDCPKTIPLGVVGTSQSIEGILSWLTKCEDGIEAKQSKQPNLFPRFPGFGLHSCFGCSIATESRWQRSIGNYQLDSLSAILSNDDLVKSAVTMFTDEITWLKENTGAKVIICAVPSKLLELMDRNISSGAATDEEDTPNVASLHIDFRHLLKAMAMPLDRSIQLVLPTTYGERRPKAKGAPTRRGIDRAIQDEATRAWNFHTALYYKAGGTPWRLVRESSAFETCYVGITFYRNHDANSVASSLAQVFNELGDGIVVRGGQARLDKDDRTPHLTDVQIEEVIGKGLTLYKKEHKHLPARLVVHKSSWFDDEEREGCLAAVRKVGVELIDLVSITQSLTRLYRVGVYPPLRGTFLSLDDKRHLLYTRGSVEFFETYPGMYVPRPLRMTLEHGEQTAKFLAREILGLTKMNWNNTQFDNSMPITIAAARQVGNVIKYVPTDMDVNPHYSFYM